MEYTALMKDPVYNHFGQEDLAKNADIPGTETCLFINLTNIPKDRKITYGKIFCDYKPHKKKRNVFS
jgi:hypothetical protein